MGEGGEKMVQGVRSIYWEQGAGDNECLRDEAVDRV